MSRCDDHSEDNASSCALSPRGTPPAHGAQEAGARLAIADAQAFPPLVILLRPLPLKTEPPSLAYTVAAGWFVVVEAASAWANPVPWQAITEPRRSDGTLTEVMDTLRPESTQRFYRLSVRP